MLFEPKLFSETHVMKNGKLILLVVGVLLVFVGTAYTVKHLRDQEQQAEAFFDTESPRTADIVLKTSQRPTPFQPI